MPNIGIGTFILQQNDDLVSVLLKIGKIIV